MARKRQPAKTPTVAITRALKDVGLVPGDDFRVTGHYDNGERKYTSVYTLNKAADRVIADNADAIEKAVEAEGFPFRVSIRWYERQDRSPVMSVRIDNGPDPRVREDEPAPVVVPEPTPVATPEPETLVDPFTWLRRTPERKPAPTVPQANITITLPAEYARQVLADLKRLRAEHPDLSTPAMHVVRTRLETALPDAPAPRAVSEPPTYTGDPTDPCEGFYAPMD